MVYDKVVSAYKTPFLLRPEGGRLDALLQPGDQVLVARLDRGFRNMRDFAATYDGWKARGIGLHFADTLLSMESATGRAMAGLLSVFAEWESSLNSERHKEKIARLKALGRRSAGRYPPRGTKVVIDTHFPNGKRVKKVVPDREKLVIMRYCRHLNRLGLGWARISDRLEAVLAKRENRKPIPRAGYGTPGSKVKPFITRPYGVKTVDQMLCAMRRQEREAAK